VPHTLYRKQPAIYSDLSTNNTSKHTTHTFEHLNFDRPFDEIRTPTLSTGMSRADK
jgi:hypothetical protein